jgi:AbrB family looped-hinge helix DNA binding protein
MTRVVLSTRGRVTIPKPIRDRLKMPAGTKVEIVNLPEGVLIKVADKANRRTVAARSRRRS